MADKDAQTGQQQKQRSPVTDDMRAQRRKEIVEKGKMNDKGAQTGQQQKQRSPVTDVMRAQRRKEHREQGEKKRAENREKEYWVRVKRRSEFREVLRL